MAYRIFILPRRTDFPGMNVQILDLTPNSSQKNNNLDGQGQTCYMPPGLDGPAATDTNGDAYVSGSLNTALLSNPVADDTTGGGNDVVATQVATFGLAAYIRERVQPGGVLLATHAPCTFAEANVMALALQGLIPAGDFSLTAINAALSGIVPGTDLDGSTGFSRSFGTRLDILRILSGEVYRSPRFVICGNAANQFLTEAARDVLVAAQDVVNNGGTTFVSKGDFLASDEAGYRNIPVLAYTEYAVISSLAGNLHQYAQDMTFMNPAFAYSAADVTQWKSRVRYIDDAGIVGYLSAPGTAPGCSIAVYVE